MTSRNNKGFFTHPSSILSAILLFAFFFSPLKAVYGEVTTASEWRELSNSDGIQVLSRHVEGSDVIAFRGIVTIDTDIGVLINTINDKSRHKQWVARLKETRTLRQESPFASLEYTRVNCPWPVSDRDFVFNSTAEIDEEKDEVKMHMRSVTDPLMPPLKGVVRAELHQSLYTLTRLERGKTRVSVEFHGDPKGWVPTWVFNIFQRRWPVVTLSRLRTQTTRPDIQKVYTYYDSLSRYYLPLMAGADNTKKDDLPAQLQVGKKQTQLAF